MNQYIGQFFAPKLKLPRKQFKPDKWSRHKLLAWLRVSLIRSHAKHDYISWTLTELTIIRTDVKPIANPAFVRRR